MENTRTGVDNIKNTFELLGYSRKITIDWVFNVYVDNKSYEFIVESISDKEEVFFTGVNNNVSGDAYYTNKEWVILLDDLYYDEDKVKQALHKHFTKYGAPPDINF